MCYGRQLEFLLTRRGFPRLTLQSSWEDSLLASIADLFLPFPPIPCSLGLACCLRIFLNIAMIFPISTADFLESSAVANLLGTTQIPTAHRASCSMAAFKGQVIWFDLQCQ